MGRSHQDTTARLPVGSVIVSSILMGIGAFILLLTSIMLSLLVYIDLTMLILGSVVSLAGMAIFMPAAISMSSALASHARSSSSTLRTALAKASVNDSKETLNEIFSLEPQTPSPLNSIKLVILSMILIIVLILSLFIALPALVRLAMLFIGAAIAPIAMITAIHSLVEETRGWFERHTALELYVFRKLLRDPGLYQNLQIPRKQLISVSMLASIITMGLYILYSLPISVLEISKHIDWHRDYEQKIVEKMS